MKVLVTGITGFVGHHLAVHLAARGYELHGLVRDAGAEDIPDGVTVHAGDVRAFEVVRDVVDSVRPDHVVHLAGAASVGASFGAPLETWDVNVNGTLAVLEAVRQAAPSARVLAVTSGEVYGRVPENALPVTEDTPLRPLSPYGASKAAADLAAAQYHAGYGLNILRVRAFNHVGPGQDPRFVIPNVARQLAFAEREGPHDVPVDIHVGNIETRRDFTDVRDMVEAYAAILERGEPGVPYVACRGYSVSIRTLVEGMAALCRREARIVSDPGLRRSGEQRDLYGSPDRIHADTGWRARIPLDVTLADSVEWWRERLETEQ